MQTVVGFLAENVFDVEMDSHFLLALGRHGVEAESFEGFKLTFVLVQIASFKIQIRFGHELGLKGTKLL